MEGERRKEGDNRRREGEQRKMKVKTVGDKDRGETKGKEESGS